MNPIEKMSEISDTVSRAISVAESKKEIIFKQTINAILVFLILIVLGCLDFATLTFHLEYLITGAYWGTVFTKTVVGILAFNLGINIMWDHELKKDFILSRNIKKYNYLSLFKTDDFEYFVVHIFNPREKEKAYISQINRRIYLLNKISRAKDRLLYSSDLPENQKLKKTNKYCIRRKELEEVDATVFELEIDGSPAVHGVKTKSNLALGRTKASGTTALGMVLVSMFLTVLGLELSAEIFADEMVAFWHYLAKCAADVFVVVWQLSKGALKTRRLISSELTQPYAGRNKVLFDYIKWRLEEGKITPEEYKEIMDHIRLIDKEEVKEENDGEYVELTEEQLKQLQETTENHSENT